LQNVAHTLDPDEWLRFFVVMSDVLVDGFDQLGHAGEHASAQTLSRDVAEESLDHVQDHSGFRYHPSVGLVAHACEDIRHQLKELVG
jgi:hypothetical protein